MNDQLPPEIETILRAQTLELVEILQRPDTKRRRFYNLRVRPLSTDRDLVLKVFGRGGPYVVSGFEKEAQFLKLVAEQGSDSLKSRIPRFVKLGSDLEPWYLREYVKGDFLGDICSDFGIRKEFLTPRLRDEFLAFFGGLQVLSRKISRTGFFSSLSPHGYDWYENDRNFYREHIQTIAQKDLDLIGENLREKKDFLDDEAEYLVHGDLYLKNMFWDVSRLTITDWELLHRGNLAFDLGFIWSLSFGNLIWREELLSHFREALSHKEQKVFAELFPVVKISLALRFIRHSEIMEEMVTGKALENARIARAVHLKTLREVLGN